MSNFFTTYFIYKSSKDIQKPKIDKKIKAYKRLWKPYNDIWKEQSKILYGFEKLYKLLLLVNFNGFLIKVYAESDVRRISRQLNRKVSKERIKKTGWCLRLPTCFFYKLFKRLNTLSKTQKENILYKIYKNNTVTTDLIILLILNNNLFNHLIIDKIVFIIIIIFL